jgi:hypothetical protein
VRPVASAVAIPTSAQNPELEAAGLVMAKPSWLAATALANSPQVGWWVSQPSRLATDSRTPITTGELMTLVPDSTTFFPCVSRSK